MTIPTKPTQVWTPIRRRPADQLGTTDGCGYSPICDVASTSRNAAFAKIRSRVLGMTLAAETIGGG